MLPTATLSLDTQGNWIHEDTLFTNKKLSTLFSRSIVFCQKRNNYILKIGNDESLFNYEKTPFIALSTYQHNDDVIFCLNTTQEITLDDSSYFFYDNNGFYVRTTALTARIRRDMYQVLSTNITDEGSILLFNKQFPIKSDEAC